MVKLTYLQNLNGTVDGGTEPVPLNWLNNFWRYNSGFEVGISIKKNSIYGQVETIKFEYVSWLYYLSDKM